MAELTNFGGSMTFDMKYDDPAQMARMLNLIQGVDSKIKKPAFKKHTKSNAWMKQNGFYRSKGEFGIKVLADDRFALLYIPNGAVVHVDLTPAGYFGFMYGFAMDSELRFVPETKNSRKHRADTAYVVAMCKLTYEQKNGKVEHAFIKPYVYHDEKLSFETVYDGTSIKYASFEYHTRAKLVIDNYDYDHDNACSEGIHFFTNANEMLDYGYGGGIFGASNYPKQRMFTNYGAELLEPWMNEQIEQFNKTWRNDIHEEPCEDDDPEESDGTVHESIYDSIDEARQAIEKIAKAVSSIKPAERTDLGRYSDRYPARGTRCNCDAADDAGDRPP